MKAKEKGDNMGFPNRKRWDGWVVFTWVLAGITTVASFLIIAEHGQIEVPNSSGWKTTTQINPLIWAVGIGQTVGALLLAALFSMVNGIYKNSCDQLRVAMGAEIRQSGEEFSSSECDTEQSSASTSESQKPSQGLRVSSIHQASPFYGKLSEGFSILRVNDHRVTSELEAASAVVDGKNYIEVLSPGGHVSQFVIKMQPGPLHIKFD
ncbi:hypothetical protein EQG41_20640 [Billgrantia azerbaijanica]|nr:hypothetical protein EQG41_20640 [Halomonas azerbaijanica]